MNAALEERIDPLLTLARLHADLDALAAVDLTGLSDDELLDYERGKERLRRRLPALDHASILEIQARGIPEAHVLRTGAFLRGLLRLDPY